MKKRMYVLISLMLIISVGVFAQYTKYFTKSTSSASHRIYTGTAVHNDTSSWRTINYKQYIELYSVVNNTDSANLLIAVQGKFQSHLQVVARDTCCLTRASGTVTPGLAKFKELRGIANSYGLPDSIRTITTVVPFTNGASDTNAWISIYMIMR